MLVFFHRNIYIYVKKISGSPKTTDSCLLDPRAQNKIEMGVKAWNDFL